MLFTQLYEDISPRERFEQTPPVTGRLVIFDIDDTLVNTTTKVGVRRDGKLVKQLNSHDFTHYELQPGEEFDFGGFRDAREFFTQARPIPGMMKQLKRDIESGNKVIMLTARADFNDRDVFLDTFRQYGIDMDRIHVYRAGNLVTRAATEEKKKIILKRLLGKHAYEKVIMYDDSVPNLNAFLSLKQDFPYTEFYAWHVDPSGQADEYHRTGLDERTQITEISRRGFLAGLAGFAAVSAMPPGLVSALSTPAGIQGMSVSDVSTLLKAIRAYLPPYDQEDWTGTFERWDKMAQALRIPDGDLDAADKLDRLMRQYRRDPEAASAKLLRHLQRHAVDLTDVRGQTIDQWDDVETVSKADPVNAEIRQMQQQIADYNAQQRREKTPGVSQAQTAATAVTAFRDLVQRVIDAGTAAASAPPREKYMGRIEPTSSAPALPAPDRSAADIMAQLRDVVGRDLTAQEQEVVAQEVGRTGTNEGLRDTLAGLALGAGVAMGGAGASDQVPTAKIEPIVATVVINGETKKLDLTPKRFNDVREAEKWLDKFMADRNIMDWQGKIERGTPGSGTYQRLTISGAGGLRESESINEGLRDTLGGLALGAGVALGGGAEAKPNVERMVVSPGQTVYSIAQAFDTTPQAIQRANRLDRNFSIKPGQTLIIPQPGVKIARPGSTPAAKPAAQQPKTAQVKKMRTLTGTKAEALLQRTALQAGLQGIELAAFLSQAKHESWNFTRMIEQRSDASAERMYGRRHSPAKAKELGNVKIGDGARYKGRGYMQLTGRDNYYRAGRALGLDLVNNPNLAAKPEIAAKIAVWYWKNRVVPKVDDFSDVRAVTRPINKGLDQLEKRKAFFLAYVDLLGLESQT